MNHNAEVMWRTSYEGAYLLTVNNPGANLFKDGFSFLEGKMLLPHSLKEWGPNQESGKNKKHSFRTMISFLEVSP